ncbi:GAF domain-containing sensor histidine kinase [Thalassobacillus pellis]|uniref:GAF domain-containing sensor histidine kinase n=1 Tax=Thalassobacillus pellis TaxID=748008 RepID=UPI001961E4B1|nr:GAF domain-containing sensor histidine kinase [Thalassobacillus pellis]MBM7551177.1 signal transduction histidine kinase [Thalassobacillus pellis]
MNSFRADRMETLKNIAELLNQSTDRNVMLNNVLEQFISMTHFEAGWLFLEQHGAVSIAADHGLPPALLRNEKAVMCGEDCYCVSRFKRNELNKATSVIGCKRIELVLERGDKETNAITHHATVPLKTPDRTFGLLNVAAPHQETYTEELELLEAVAFQIGSALERIEQYEQQKNRSELLSTAHAITQELQTVSELQELLDQTAEKLRMLFQPDHIEWKEKEVLAEKKPSILSALVDVRHQLLMQREIAFSETEKEVFTLLMEYINIYYRRIIVNNKEKDLARVEERSRLAQDLHDSISQLLFSIVLTSKSSIPQAKGTDLEEKVEYIHELSSQAMKEMRMMIAQQKAVDLKQGVLLELIKYGKLLGLKVEGESEGTITLPYVIEEMLLRIGQEALHNVHKHARTESAAVNLHKTASKVLLTIKDQGCGFDTDQACHSPSFGLKGMKERVALYNGNLIIKSKKNQGTVIDVEVPLEVEENDDYQGPDSG